ncbi:flagellar hook assembly protein FlgD [Noviherbaspirillum sp. 1P10PC]|uniref:flagellar hook assembly protein FlgD n=1 Tax=Noviherbaspirillum sp. 1P10PC TaxID=3132292 RepID=UPI0039A3E1F4
MTTISDNTVSPALLNAMNSSKASAASAEGIAGTQDRFMKLLITQMKNQDPLNPMDNAQVTSQMAQLSTVTGIEKLNASMSSMQSSYQASQTMQATSLIGHGVLVPGSSAMLADGKAVLGIELPAAADKVTVTIRDGAGKAIHKIELGEQAAGTLPLAWDGKTDSGAAAANGQYSFDVTASSAGSAIKASTLTFGQVGSVSTGASGVKLNLTNGASATMADVREII